MASGAIISQTRIGGLIRVILVASGLIVAQSLTPSRSDPLLLGRWIDDEPVPEDVLQAVQRHGSSTFSQHGRRLMQPLQPNALSVRPGQCSECKTGIWITSNLNPAKSNGFSIPSTFLGISHEWTNLEEFYTKGGSYLQLIRDLTAYGGGPLVLRVGGGSTDKQTTLPSPETWQGLKQLQYSTGMMFIFGLNFYKKDVQFAKQQMQAIFENIPSYAIQSFEVGNEPNFYEGRYGKSAKDYIACCFVNEWEKFVMAVTCQKTDVYSTCVYGRFAGPAWGHVNMYPSTMDWFLQVNYQWMNLVTVHWYKATKETPNTVTTLLDEGPIRDEMANLQKLVAISRKYGKDLRVAEMNTISNSGRSGLSDSLAAALWTLDGAFEVANTGAVGINLHWGDGLAVYAALLRQASGASIVKPTYYAYLLFQMALGSGSHLIGQQTMNKPGTKIKVWPLEDEKSGVARVVIINKHATAGTGVYVQLPDWGYSHGKLIRLLGKRGLSDEWGVSLGNMTYTLTGQPFGYPAGEIIYKEQPQRTTQEKGSNLLQYKVYMPPASAALLIVPKETSSG